MTTPKDKYYNNFLNETMSIFLILMASLIPWFEFINSNFQELDNIFNDNFLFLIILYFIVVILLYLLTKLLFRYKKKLYYISLIGISIWVFFQYNLKFFLFKIKVNVIMIVITKNNDISDEICHK